MSDLCPRRYIGVCRGGVSVSELCRRNYIGVIAVIFQRLQRRCRLERSRSRVKLTRRRRSYVGVCRGDVSVSDLRRRS